MSGIKAYIVVFKDTATEEQIKEIKNELTEQGGRVDKEFNSDIMKGFSGEIPDSYLQVLKNIRTDVVDYVEEDQRVTTQ